MSLSKYVSPRNVLLAGTVTMVVASFAFKLKTKQKLSRSPSTADLLLEENKGEQQTEKIGVNKEFFLRLRRILKVAIPSGKSATFLNLVTLTALLFARTSTTMRISDVLSQAVRSLVERDRKNFTRHVLNFALLGIPAAVINSLIKFCSDRLAVDMATKLVYYSQARYLAGINAYRILNLRVGHPLKDVDQRITQDVAQWAETSVRLYSNLTKPTVDVLLYGVSLAQVVGARGIGIMLGHFFASSLVLRAIAPSFGKLSARSQKLTGFLRFLHSRFAAKSEEIAFSGGSNWERRAISDAYNASRSHSLYVQYARAWVGALDGFLVKYGATTVGLAFVLGGLAFRPGQADSSTGELTQEFVKGYRLLSSMSDAISRIILSYKEIATLAGFTSRVCELLDVLDDEAKRSDRLLSEEAAARVSRAQASGALERKGSNKRVTFNEKPEVKVAASPAGSPTTSVVLDEKASGAAAAMSSSSTTAPTASIDPSLPLSAAAPGEAPTPTSPNKRRASIIKDENARLAFHHVDIATPDGRLLIRDVDFELKKGMHLLIVGPNGSGKSCLFRVARGLWQPAAGFVERPSDSCMYFCPQTPYLPIGTLRDAVIYPDSVEAMHARGRSDDDIVRFLELADLAGLAEREGLDSVKQWDEQLSGGESQKVAIARVFYHKPVFAFLDEATSMISGDLEPVLYQRLKDLGITLVSIAHRRAVWPFHDFRLRLEHADDSTFKAVFGPTSDHDNGAAPLPPIQRTLSSANLQNVAPAVLRAAWAAHKWRRMSVAEYANAPSPASSSSAARPTLLP